MTVRRRFGILMAVVALAGCGGGGGSAPSGGIPTAPGPGSGSTPPPPPPPTTGIARITIAEPLTTSAAARAVREQTRRPSHLPASTQTILVAANGSAGVSFPYSATGPTCVNGSGVKTCTFDATVPAGNDTLVVQAVGASGRVLSTATAQVTITATLTVVPIALLGVPAGAGVKLAQRTSPVGTPTSIPIAVTAQDADNNPIVGTYATPISLVDSDTSGHTSISNAVTSSTSTVSLVYDGKPVNARVSYPGVPTGGDLFASSLPVHEFTSPSGQVTATNAGNGTIVLGSDGAMWFGEQNGIGRVDTSGAITEYPTAQPQQLVRGPDDAVWFTTVYDRITQVSGELCRVAPNGTVTKFGRGYGLRITVGADGNFWIIDGRQYVTRVTTAGVATLFGVTGPAGAYSVTADIATAPDGNLWIFDAGGRIYIVSTAGTQLGTIDMHVPTTSDFYGARSTFGADGAFWLSTQSGFYRVTSGGAVSNFTQFPGTLASTSGGLGGQAPILSASDANMWSTGTWLFGLPTMFRESNGLVLALPLPPAVSQPPFGGTTPVGIANGPNGSIWYVRGNSVGWFTPPG